jgi:hypothetical protein
MFKSPKNFFINLTWFIGILLSGYGILQLTLGVLSLIFPEAQKIIAVGADPFLLEEEITYLSEEYLRGLTLVNITKGIVEIVFGILLVLIFWRLGERNKNSEIPENSP